MRVLPVVIAAASKKSPPANGCWSVRSEDQLKEARSKDGGENSARGGGRQEGRQEEGQEEGGQEEEEVDRAVCLVGAQVARPPAKRRRPACIIG